MACGAQPTSKVAWLLGKAGILPEQPRPEPVVAPPAPAVDVVAPPAPPRDGRCAGALPRRRRRRGRRPGADARAFSSRRRLAPLVGAVGAFRSDVVVAHCGRCVAV